MAGTPPKTYLFWPFWPSLTRRRRRRKSKKTKVEARSLWELRCRGIEWYYTEIIHVKKCKMDISDITLWYSQICSYNVYIYTYIYTHVYAYSYRRYIWVGLRYKPIPQVQVLGWVSSWGWSMVVASNDWSSKMFFFKTWHTV